MIETRGEPSGPTEFANTQDILADLSLAFVNQLGGRQIFTVRHGFSRDYFADLLCQLIEARVPGISCAELRRTLSFAGAFELAFSKFMISKEPALVFIEITSQVLQKINEALKNWTGKHTALLQPISQETHLKFFSNQVLANYCKRAVLEAGGTSFEGLKSRSLLCADL